MEKLMQFVWQHRLWDYTPLRTSDGRRVRIIHPGTLNHDSGPDFSTPQLKSTDSGGPATSRFMSGPLTGCATAMTATGHTTR